MVSLKPDKLRVRRFEWKIAVFFLNLQMVMDVDVKSFLSFTNLVRPDYHLEVFWLDRVILLSGKLKADLLSTC